MEPLRGLLCAKHVPIGKEWGWDKEFAQHKMFATELRFSVLGSPAAAAPCLEAHAIHSPQTHIMNGVKEQWQSCRKC